MEQQQQPRKCPQQQLIESALPGILYLTACWMLLIGGPAEIVIAQNLCQFITPTNQSTTLTSANSTLFVVNFPSNKCLRVSAFGHQSNSKLFLDECSWWKNISADQTFSLSQPSKIITDGFALQVPTGLRAELNCWSTNNDGNLITQNCRSSSLDQLWKFKPVSGHPNQYLIQQSSSSKCLLPKTMVTTSAIKLAPCNSYETEQIWKLCSLGSSTMSKN